MIKLVLPPNEDGYNPRLGNGILSQQLLGGMPRQRRNFVGSIHTLDATWSLNIDEMELIFAFYNVYQNEPNPFLMDLIVDSTSIKEYQCRCVSELTWTKQGNLWRANLSLNILPSHRNLDDDKEIIDYWQAGLKPVTSNLFKKLANEALPDALRNYL